MGAAEVEEPEFGGGSADAAATLVAPSAYFMKSPPVQYPDDQARTMVEGFIAGEEP